uniref:Uncharacterized protein n=1 Tax=Romanomermis culicivorax TaxID=13658 RepID=A0A915HMB9_ROMCU
MPRTAFEIFNAKFTVGRFPQTYSCPFRPKVNYQAERFKLLTIPSVEKAYKVCWNDTNTLFEDKSLAFESKREQFRKYYILEVQIDSIFDNENESSIREDKFENC